MKKLIFMILAIFATAFFMGCDPIEDAENETRYLIFKGEKGDVGPQGPAGPVGPSGQPCSVASITNEQGRQGIKINCGSRDFYVWNGLNGANGLNGTDGADGIDGQSCSIVDIAEGVQVTCGTNTFIIYDGEDGNDGTCIDCCPDIKILTPPCSTEFVILRIQIGDSIRFISTEPVYLGTSILNGFRTELVQKKSTGEYQWYKYVNATCSTPPCIFRISDDGLSLIEN
jgi:hypothetical protein